MTQPSKRFDIWRRLYTRFLIEPFPAEGASPAVSTLVTPITDADELLRQPTGFELTTQSPATDATPFTVAQVPAGRRWNLQTINVTRTTGDNTFSRIIIGDDSALVSVILEIFTGTNGRTLLLPSMIRMDEGDTVRVQMDGVGVAASNIRALLWLEEEDAF